LFFGKSRKPQIPVNICLESVRTKSSPNFLLFVAGTDSIHSYVSGGVNYRHMLRLAQIIDSAASNSRNSASVPRQGKRAREAKPVAVPLNK